MLFTILCYSPCDQGQLFIFNISSKGNCFGCLFKCGKHAVFDFMKTGLIYEVNLS